MEIRIIDLHTNTMVKITDCEQFKNINIGHKVILKYKDEYGTNRFIDGTICSIEHEIDKNNESFNYTLNIKVF